MKQQRILFIRYFFNNAIIIQLLNVLKYLMIKFVQDSYKL